MLFVCCKEPPAASSLPTSPQHQPCFAISSCPFWTGERTLPPLQPLPTMGPAPQDPAQEFIPNSVYLQIKSYRSLHLTLGHRAQGDSALHGDVPFPEEQGLFAQASPGGSDSLEPALSVCGHGKAEPGTAKELGGAHPNFHGELGPPPFPGEISHGKGRDSPGATSASETGSKEGSWEAGGGSHPGEAGEVGDAAGVVHVACQEHVALVAPLLAPAMGRKGRA